MDRCDACGFRYEQTPAEIPAALGALPSRYHLALNPGTIRATTDRTRIRPTATTWSPLEYACHLRDVLLVQRERVYQTLIEDHPSFAVMHRDERVTVGRYNEQPVELVIAAIDMAVTLLAGLVEPLTVDQWARRCIYNYPAPADRTVLWVLQQTLHEGQHHLDDIARGMRG